MSRGITPETIENLNAHISVHNASKKLPEISAKKVFTKAHTVNVSRMKSPSNISSFETKNDTHSQKSGEVGRASALKWQEPKSQINIYDQSFTRREPQTETKKGRSSGREKVKPVSSANTSFQSRFLVKKKEQANINQKDNLTSLIRSRKVLNSSLPESSFSKAKGLHPAKSKRRQKLEKLVKELQRNGIKLDVKDCESVDEDLIKNLLNIKRLIMLKNENFGGESLEIIKMGKEILLQVGKGEPRGQRESSSKRKSSGYRRRAEKGQRNHQNSVETTQTSPNIYSSENLVKRSSEKKCSKKENRDRNGASKSQSRGPEKPSKERVKVRKMESDLNFKKKKESNRKQRGRVHPDREERRRKRRPNPRQSKRNTKRADKKGSRAKNTKTDSKAWEVSYFTRKTCRNSYTNGKESNKSANYLDMYQGRPGRGANGQ